MAAEEATTTAAADTTLEATKVIWDLRAHTCRTLEEETLDHATWAVAEATDMAASHQQAVLLTEAADHTTWMREVTMMKWATAVLEHLEVAQAATTMSPSVTEVDPKRRMRATP